MARSFVAASSQSLDYAGAVVTGVPLTMACWFNSTSNSLTQVLLSLADNTATDRYLELTLRGADAGDPVVAEARNSTLDIAAATTVGYAINTWQHAAAVYASATSRSAYLNGGSKGTSSANVTPTGINRTSIGRLPRSAPTAYMSGRIADAAIYNVALTDAEVAALASGFATPLDIRRDALVAYWPLIGSDLFDLSGGGFAMTATGVTVADGPPVRMPLARRSRIFLPATAGGTNYTLAASVGSFALSGQSAGLKVGRKVAASAGAFALAGQPAGLLVGRKVIASAGAFTLSGQAAAFLRTYRIAAAAGSFSLAGQPAGLKAARKLTATVGAFALSGQSATLTKSTAGAYTLTAAAGSFALAGQAAGLKVARRLVAAAGSFALAGQAAGLTVGHRVIAAAGNFALSGQAVGLKAARRLTAAVGTFSLTGQAANLTKSTAGTYISAALWLLYDSQADATPGPTPTPSSTITIDPRLFLLLQPGGAQSGTFVTLPSTLFLILQPGKGIPGGVAPPTAMVSIEVASGSGVPTRFVSIEIVDEANMPPTRMISVSRSP